MSERWGMVEKTKRPDGVERFEIHLGSGVYILTLERGATMARWILSLLDIDVAQLESSLAEAQAELAGNALMDAEAESFISGQELVPKGTLEKIERLREVRNELASLYDENEPHEMGGPHISLLYVIDKIDETLNLPTNG